MKRYGQRCPAARALDVIGERWTPLVVRELLSGPKRFTDLVDGLPGIGTNILTSRLAALQEHGVVEKRTLPRPAPVAVYELTEAGHALAPLMRELRAWGERYGPRPQPGDAVRPAWILQSAASNNPRLGHTQSCELHVDDDVFLLTRRPDGVELTTGAGAQPDAVVKLDERLFLRLATDRIKPAAALREMEIEGDRRVASAVAAMLAGAAG
jgi:DNA-binding HxlR family transcriptional regulator